MKTLSRHKAFIKDMRTVPLGGNTGRETFVYVAKLLNDVPLPAEAKDHALQGEWNDIREKHLGGDMLLIYQIDEQQVYLIRLGSHFQLFKNM